MIIPKRSAEIKYLAISATDVLNETLGVTDNTDAVVQFFKDTSDECLNLASDSPAANSMFDIAFCNGYEHQQTKFSYTYIFKFSIPDSNNTLSWLSNDSKIIIICNRYESQKDRLADTVHGGGSLKSAYQIKDGQSVAEFIFEYSFVKDAVSNGFYISGQWFRDTDMLEYGYQHELNHVHKNKDIKDSRYIANYNAVGGIFRKYGKQTEIKDLAFSIYCYCIEDEANAYIEGFYKQYKVLKDKDWKDTEQWQTSKQCINALKKYQQWYIENFDMIYDMFKNINLYYLKLKYHDNPEQYITDMVDRIIEKIRQFQRKCIRTTCIPESYLQTEFGKIYRFETFVI